MYSCDTASFDFPMVKGIVMLHVIIFGSMLAFFGYSIYLDSKIYKDLTDQTKQLDSRMYENLLDRVSSLEAQIAQLKNK